MDCKKIDDLMIKIIDGNLPENEKIIIEKHCEECDFCREKYLMFSQINDFSENEIYFENEIFDPQINVKTPENFESLVMKKITGIEFKTNRLFCYVLGSITVFFALMRFLFFNNAFFIQAADKNPYFKGLFSFFYFIDELCVSLCKFLVENFQNFFDFFSDTAIYFRYYGLALFILIIGIKYIFYINKGGGNRV